MKLEATPLAGLFLVHRPVHDDDRGSFTRLYGAAELESQGVQFVPRQVNRSVTAHAGTVRGIHLQYPPHAEAKLVTCTRGTIYDVAVDLRPESPTFLGSWGVHLSADGPLSVYVPEGFAHGFVSTVDDVEVVYVASEQHAPDFEDGIRFDDPALGIEWPTEPRHMSDKDAKWPALADRLDAVRTRMSAASTRHLGSQ